MADIAVRLIFVVEFADTVERAVEGPGIGRMVGDKLGEAIDLAIAHLQHTPGILQHGAGLQATEGDDLRDMIAAIFPLNVADHFLAPGFAEIDVEIRHRHAFRIKEAFEQ